jgi:hypothetical protein
MTTYAPDPRRSGSLQSPFRVVMRCLDFGNLFPSLLQLFGTRSN